MPNLLQTPKQRTGVSRKETTDRSIFASPLTHLPPSIPPPNCAHPLVWIQREGISAGSMGKMNELTVVTGETPPVHKGPVMPGLVTIRGM